MEFRNLKIPQHLSGSIFTHVRRQRLLGNGISNRPLCQFIRYLVLFLTVLLFSVMFDIWFIFIRYLRCNMYCRCFFIRYFTLLPVSVVWILDVSTLLLVLVFLHLHMLEEESR